MEMSAAIFAKGLSVSASPSVDFLSLVFVSVELTMEEAKQEITKEEVVDSAPNAAPLVLLARCEAEVDDIGMETIVGQYQEVGVHHGRKFFKRDDGNAFLFFWDSSDGPEFSGWWFGDRVGGGTVWSRCESKDLLPPVSGWRIPWDGQVVQDLAVEHALGTHGLV